MTHAYDIAILGSGFGGSLMSMVAHRLGLSVLLVERGTHPRFAIGESTSPLTNLLLEQIADTYDLPFLKPFTSFGPWQRSYPHIAVGLKRGFTYYHHTAGHRFARDEDRRSQLMVAASRSNEVSDTHWYRSAFDEFLVHQAIAMGVEYSDYTQIEGITRSGDNEWSLRGSRQGEPYEVNARLILDATGPRGVLQRLFQIPESQFPDFPKTQALFTHFTGVERCDALTEYCVPGSPPFPPDDAALHHLFDGGWMWVLRFGNGITSVGVSITDDLAEDLGLPGDRSYAWQRFLDRFPSVAVHLAAAVPTLPLIHSARLSFRTSQAAGDGWVMLPSATAFIDPLFSTGIPLTLLGIERLGRILQRHWTANTLRDELRVYADVTLMEADSTAEFVGASLRSLSAFPVFAAFSMFYFAAASYSEMARRMDRGHLVTRFLAADRSDFRIGMQRCIEAMPAVLANPSCDNVKSFEALVEGGIECLNIAGLADRSRRNWYGVDLQDVVRNAHKLQMTPEAVTTILADAPWARS